MRLSQIAWLQFGIVLTPAFASSQATPVAIETRVRLRAGPSTADQTIRLLNPRDTLRLVSADSISSNLLYLHVVTPTGDTGWVSTSFAHRVRPTTRAVPQPDTTRTSQTPSLGSAVPLPASATSASENELLRLCGTSCGSERWRIKTLTDADEPQVDYTPVPATVAHLRSFPHPASTSATHRSGDIERTTYQVNGRIIGWLQEGDEDIHLVIAGTSNTQTIIAEIPNKACTYVCSSPQLSAFNQARADVIAKLGNPPSNWHTMTGKPVSITGVGFFDFKHHQHGLAPNAIELHPVLNIVFK